MSVLTQNKKKLLETQKKDYFSILSSSGKTWFSNDSNIDHKQLKRPKITKKKEIVYQFFEDASNICTDPFWVSILKNAAIGKFQRGFQFKNGILSFKVKGKLTSFVINTNTPEETLQSILDSMRDICEVLSETDKEKKMEEYNHIVLTQKVEVINSWSQISSSIDKKIAINIFIKEQCELKKLTPLQKKDLEDIILLGLNMNVYNIDTINVVNGRIDSIDGLLFNSNGRFYMKEVTTKKKISTKSVVIQDDSTNELCENEIQDNGLNYNKLLINFLKKLNTNFTKYDSQ